MMYMFSLILQARNEHDMHEWVNVINNLAQGSASGKTSPVKHDQQHDASFESAESAGAGSHG